MNIFDSLQKDTFCNYYVYANLFHYLVGKRFKDLAMRNWNLLKADVLTSLRYKLGEA